MMMFRKTSIAASGLNTVVALAIALAIVVTGADSAEIIAIRNAQIHTITGVDYSDVIENGDIIVSDGVIVAIGQNLPMPEGAAVIDASGRVVTPGIMAPWSHLGLMEIGSASEANDASPDWGFPYGAALNARDAYNPFSTLIPVSRAGGFTRALSAPAPGESMFGGVGMVIDLSGTRGSITKAGAAQSVVMGSAGASRAGDTRLGSWLVLREALSAAQKYAADPDDYGMRPHDERFMPADLRALAPVLSGEQPLIISVNGSSEILNVIQLKEEFGLNVIIYGGREGWQVASELANAEIPLIIDPLANLPSQFDSLRATLFNAARLHQAGVMFGFSGPGSHHLHHMPKSAGVAVANGLPYGAALAAMTIAPATMFGLDDQLGSLEVGKTADIVVWTGDPLELNTRPSTVLINGQVMSLETRQTKLRDRYLDLSRGNLPLAYRSGE